MLSFPKLIILALICAFAFCPVKAEAKVVDKIIDYTADGAYHVTKYTLKGAWYVTELAAKGAKWITKKTLNGIKDIFDEDEPSRPVPVQTNDYADYEGETLPLPPPIIE